MRMGTELRNSFTVNLLMSFLPNNTEKKENPLWQILRGKRGRPFFNCMVGTGIAPLRFPPDLLR